MLVAILLVSLAKTLGVLSFTPLTMLQACAQAVDFKVGHHFGEGQGLIPVPFPRLRLAKNSILGNHPVNRIVSPELNGLALSLTS